MLHGIDLKTHSQCQMLGANAPTCLDKQDLFRFIYRNKIPGGAYRDRTDDPLLAKQVLSQLS